MENRNNNRNDTRRTYSGNKSGSSRGGSYGSSGRGRSSTSRGIGDGRPSSGRPRSGGSRDGYRSDSRSTGHSSGGRSSGYSSSNRSGGRPPSGGRSTGYSRNRRPDGRPSGNRSDSRSSSYSSDSRSGSGYSGKRQILGQTNDPYGSGSSSSFDTRPAGDRSRGDSYSSRGRSSNTNRGNSRGRSDNRPSGRSGGRPPRGANSAGKKKSGGGYGNFQTQRPSHKRNNPRVYGGERKFQMPKIFEGDEMEIMDDADTKNRLKVCTLSGTSEVGRNCNFIQYGDDIVMVDAGFSFPGQELYGIDYLIPNISYLRKNKANIRGILITHGHLDHTGALPYILPELDYPTIYGGKFANALIKARLEEFNLEKKVKFVDIDRNTEVELGTLKAKFIGVTHSIPNSFSIFVKSPEGNVFFSGDYKIDEAPANEPESDYESLKALQGQVDLALMESTNPSSKGKAKSEQEIAGNLEKIILSHDGRIVLVAFSSLVSRLYSVIKIAEKTGRKVFLSGRSIKLSIQIAREQGYINIPDNLILDERKLSETPDDKVLFLCTGSQGERYASLNRISLGEHKFFKAKQGDLVILSASEIPSNVVQIEKMTDRLITTGVELVQKDYEQIHESGHALQIDMQMMYDMVKPKEVLPIHGSLTMRYKNKRNYVAWGVPSDKVHLTKDGQVWVFVNGTWKRGKQLPSKPILIDGLGVGDIGDEVIKDRQQLAEYGMLTIIMNISNTTFKLMGHPRFVSRGFVYVKTSGELFGEVEDLVKDIHRDWMNGPDGKDVRALTKLVESEVGKLLYKKTEREPIVLAVTV